MHSIHHGHYVPDDARKDASAFLLRREVFNVAAQRALRSASSAVVVAATSIESRLVHHSQASSAEGIGNPDAPPVGDLSCIASLRLNRSLVSSAARHQSTQRLKPTHSYLS